LPSLFTPYDDSHTALQKRESVLANGAVNNQISSKSETMLSRLERYTTPNPPNAR